MKPPNSPAIKDIAEFQRLALQLQLRDVSAVIRWVDREITSQAEPPTWLFDLSLGRNLWPDEIESVLQNIPGEATVGLPEKMIVAILRREWLSGRVNDDRLIEIWYRLYPEIPAAPRSADEEVIANIWIYLDCVLMCFESGHYCPTHACAPGITIQDAHVHLAAQLEHFARFESLVPAD